jgi:hypothetical protein
MGLNQGQLTLARGALHRAAERTVELVKVPKGPLRKCRGRHPRGMFKQVAEGCDECVLFA